MKYRKPSPAEKFGALLGLLFIGLRLCGEIEWSWVAVTAPVWGTFLSACVVTAIVDYKKH